MNSLIYILISANVIAFIQMAIDKRLAVKQKSRIPEAQLIAPTLFGGIIGVVLGMILFRHKTAKKSFQFKLFMTLVTFGLVVFVTLRSMK